MGIAAVIAFGILFLIYNAIRKSRLAKYFSETSIGRDLQHRVNVAKAKQREADEVKMRELQEKALRAVQTGDKSMAPGLMEIMFPLVRRLGETMRDANQKVNRAMAQVHDEVKLLAEGNRHFRQLVGEIHSMDISEADFQGDGEHNVMSVTFDVIGSDGHGQISVTADTYEEGGDAPDLDITLTSATLRVEGQREEVHLLKKKRVIVDI
eukprot:CAMPEP_0173394926 /NCGR_PEP_ID=MMETSP1356-20130122/30068_1 /TAXON_ID=77927 ORGANISM="Hemiselmis virescens, Strain PCC157" /NCGR_SAMPLE_ID=MMETSP1356 /ASSEMBLY_ACC=CAM_ASM_000847 /LENGTH=208 /DNA_ID=CAMNT_0014353501 /DNA_START=87 /DNA_END=713 /DNA_ORIENTATION=-